MRTMGPRLLPRAILCLVVIFLCPACWAADDEQPLAQMNHRVWTARDGAPNFIFALAQTTDGVLWLGTDDGLYRFDGLQFVRFTGATGRPFDSNAIADVEAAPGGGLWVGFQFGGIAFIKDGIVATYSAKDGLPEGSVWKIVTDPSGTVWAAVSSGLFLLRGSHWEEIRSDSGRSLQPIGLAADSAGTIWVQTQEEMLARPAGEIRFRSVAQYALANEYRNANAIAPDGSMWVGTQSEGVLRIDAPTNSQPIGTRSLDIGKPQALLFDHSGDLWCFDGGKLERLPPDIWKSADLMGKSASQIIGDGSDDNLPIGSPTSNLLEDREGNLWVATSNELHRFSHSNVRVLNLPQGTSAQGVVAGDGGAIWVTALNLPSQEGSLVEISNGAVISRRETGLFASEIWGPDDSLWLAGPAGLAHLVDGRLLSTPLPAEARGPRIQAMVRDATGAIWLSIVQRGVYRWKDGQWTAYGGHAGLPRAPAIAEASDHTGALWLGYTHARIARVEDSAVRTFTGSDGIDVGDVTALYASGTHLWAGGDFGLERFDGAHFVPIYAASGDPFRGLTGIVETATGELWVNGGAGIVRVPAAEIVRAIREPTYRVQYELFDELDGVPGKARPLSPTPSAIEASDGLLWFAVGDSLVSIDPLRLRRNPIAPPVDIWTVRAGDRIYAAPSQVTLPAKTTDMEVDYTAESLTMPERVHFKYRLEGLDQAWQDGADRRQAFFTNLRPGTYTFRVIAANEDGVWNTVGASLPITIQPAFYQTRWFYALCALASFLVLWLLYGMRMRRVRRQVRGRLEERLIERERIARDLHDTLLQGIQGLILRFQVASDRIPRGEPAHDLMERALERADEVLEESRSRVKELRIPLGGEGDLSEALADSAQPLSAAHSVPYSITVTGTQCPLHPIVREETYLIASEAISNAYRHAKASKIEIQLTYGEGSFLLSVRDDGQGVDDGVLSAGGKPEHWGLLGMRERARRIRGQLTIRSDPRTGTDVQLRLPAEMAYQERDGAHLAGWWRRLCSRGGTTPLA